MKASLLAEASFPIDCYPDKERTEHRVGQRQRLRPHEEAETGEVPPQAEGHQELQTGSSKEGVSRRVLKGSGPLITPGFQTSGFCHSEQIPALSHQVSGNLLRSQKERIPTSICALTPSTQPCLWVFIHLCCTHSPPHPLHA